MSLLTEAKQVITKPDFVIGEKDNTILPEKCNFRMNSIIQTLKGKDMRNFNLPYVTKEVNKFLSNNPDPEMIIHQNVVITLLENLVYSSGRQATAEDKVIIGYLALYCSIQ